MPVDLDRVEANRVTRRPGYGRTQVCITEEDFRAMAAELRTLRARVAEVERDARLGAVVREAVGDDAHLFEAFAEPVRREHADTGIERAPVYDRVPVAIADALRAEEGGEHG